MTSTDLLIAAFRLREAATLLQKSAKKPIPVLHKHDAAHAAVMVAEASAILLRVKNGP
jgi:hypothetical protein